MRTAALVAVSILLLVVAGAAREESPVADRIESAPVHVGVGTGANPQVQETSISERTTPAVLTFWQNRSAAPYGASTRATFPVSLGVPFSTISSVTATLFATMSSSLTPRIVAIQSPNVLANATWPYANLLPVVYDSASVVVSVSAAYNSTGGPPSVGVYQVYLNLSLDIAFEENFNATWLGNQGGYWSENYSFVSPVGATLNSTVVFVPFPASNVTANASSVAVYLNTRPMYTFQVVAGGVYEIVPGIPASSSEHLVTQFAAAPILSGKAPILSFSTYVGTPSAGYQAAVTWNNPYPAPYEGQYVIIGKNLPYPINPASLEVGYSGIQVRNTSWVVQSNTITILSGAILALPNQILSIQLHFNFSNVPNSYSAALGYLIVPYGTGGFTLGDLLLVLMLVTLIATVVGYYTRTDLERDLDGNVRRRGRTKARRRVAVNGAVFLVVLIAAYLALWIS